MNIAKISKYLGSIIIASVGILLIISGFIIGVMPESHPLSREYGGIIAIMLLILGFGVLIYARIYLKNATL